MDATGTIPLLRLLLTECAELPGAMVSLELATSRGVLYKHRGE
jgi:hypothetical protein